MTDPIWNALRLTPPAHLLEPLAGWLMEMGADGTWEDGADVVAYFPEAIRPDEVEHSLAAYLGHMEACGVVVFTPQLCWEHQGEGDWITAWKDHFVPIPVGDSLMVLPEWEPDALAEGRIPLKIRPGRGFGTGGHGTTATCLARLEAICQARDDLNGTTVLDVGTGSGILAIAAKKLGCGTVLGFDNDPDAVQNARENAEINRVNLELFTGTVDQIAGKFDVVLANLLAHVIVELMPELKRVLAPGGVLILSGILNEQVDRIDAALKEHRLQAVNYTSEGMWLTVEAKKL